MNEFEKAYNLIADSLPDLQSNLLYTLPNNPVYNSLANKIANQWLIDGFDYGNKILQRYVRASSFAGGIDEIVSSGMVGYRQYDINADTIDERHTAEQYRVWAHKAFNDVYMETIYEFQAQEAFVNASTFGSFIGLLMKRFEDTKRTKWFGRLIGIYKEFPMVITLQADDNDMEAVAKEITLHMSKMRQPSTAYNVVGKVNSTPYEKQQLTWNTKYMNSTQWITARLFQQGNINNINKVIWGDDIDFNDDTIIAVLDTADTIYLGLKYTSFNYMPRPDKQYINYYRTEKWIYTIVPWANGVIFKTASSGAQKQVLDEVLTNKNITTTALTEEAMLEAVKTANPAFEPTQNEKTYILSFDGATKKGIVRVNSGATSKYLGYADLNFTLNETGGGSSNFGR